MPVVLESESLGEAWLIVVREILESGALATYDGETTRELSLLTLVVERPSSDDPVIARLGDPEWLAWMHENFFVPKDVAELGGAQSYAVRLFNYESAGRDQIAWVTDRLRADPACRSATITTFQPLSDTTYVPCVSMLDFWQPAQALELVVYAHSLDFGKRHTATWSSWRGSKSTSPRSWTRQLDGWSSTRNRPTSTSPSGR
jgi:hypothetical protein